jgi:glycerophosphoryl diester phosphodiesterase
MGADGAELDVRLSADGIPMVFHDRDLARLFKRKSVVSDLSARALRRLSFGPRFGDRFAAEKIPSLDDALEILSGLVVNIEIKSETIPDGRLEARVAACIRNAGAEDRVVVSSFNPLSLAAFRRIDPEVPTGFLFGPKSRRGLRGPMAGYALRTRYLNPNSDMVDRARVARWHADGFGVMTWTIDEETEAKRCAACEVDAIITNYPDMLVKIRGQRSEIRSEHSRA